MPQTAGSRPDQLTVEAVVDTPSGPHNRFIADTRLHALRLSEVVTDQPRSGADLGHLPATSGPGIPPLRALILSQIPLPVGCIVEGCPIGMAEHAGVVLLAPTTDAGLVGLRRPAELTSQKLSQLQAQIRRLDPSGGLCIWLDPDITADRIRQQIEQAKRATLAEEQYRSNVPLWRTGDRSVARSDGGEVEPHTIAEYAVPRLPQRFQEYIARMLLPEERILLFIHRPAAALTRRPRLLGGIQLAEGILVVTDRQVLFMEDVLPPGATMVHWGFDATLFAIERLNRATVVENRRIATLAVTVGGAYGEESLRFDFPVVFRPALQEAAGMLNPFSGRPPTRALRRVYPASEEKHDNAPAWAGELLDARPIAWAEAATRGRGVGGRVTLSPERLVIRPEGQPLVSIDTAAITSIRLTISLLGCSFSVVAPQNGALQKQRIKFEYPQEHQFAAVTATLRSILGNPPHRCSGSAPPAALSTAGG